MPSWTSDYDKKKLYCLKTWAHVNQTTNCYSMPTKSCQKWTETWGLPSFLNQSTAAVMIIISYFFICNSKCLCRLFRQFTALYCFSYGVNSYTQKNLFCPNLLHTYNNGNLDLKGSRRIFPRKNYDWSANLSCQVQSKINQGCFTICIYESILWNCKSIFISSLEFKSRINPKIGCSY